MIPPAVLDRFRADINRAHTKDRTDTIIRVYSAYIAQITGQALNGEASRRIKETLEREADERRTV